MRIIFNVKISRSTVVLFVAEQYLKMFG